MMMMQAQQKAAPKRTVASVGALWELPEDLLQALIAFYLADYSDVFSLAYSCKALYVFIHDNSELWKQSTIEKFGGSFTYHASGWKATNVAAEKSAELSAPPLVFHDEMWNSLSASLYPELRTRVRRAQLPMSKLQASRDDVERVSFKSISAAEFSEKYDAGNKPVIITNLVQEWPALKTWQKEQLAQRFHGKPFLTNFQLRSGKKVEMEMNRYIDYMEKSEDETPIYLFDPAFAERAPELLNDFVIPEFFTQDYFEVLPKSSRPTYRWIVIGPKKSGSPFHIDPYRTSAWNALLYGRKRWLMFPLDVVPPGVSDPSKTWVDEKEDGTDEENALLPIEWVLKFYEKHINDPNSKMVECVQHAVLSTVKLAYASREQEDTISVTQNFGNEFNWPHVWSDIRLNHTKLAQTFEEHLSLTKPSLLA